ncbi:hypothetical protein LPJ56_003112, partial [Coemansia sp. RSA 2599]
MKQLQGLLTLSILSTLSLADISGELGICLKDLVFGQDAGNQPFTPKHAIFSGKARQAMVVPGGDLYERDIEDGLEVVIAAGGGLIDIANING